ncbi:MAG: alpha/beta fold hydrolase [Hyphomicrobiales bacterium]|nr:alpha/beta fold hydrolase [Hyphomicrobiales bacterium]
MDTVALLHGIANRAASLYRIELALRAAGYNARGVNYPSTSCSIDEIVDRIDAQLTTLAAQTPGRLHIVAHSMGGLVARAWLARRRAQNTGALVMLGTPNGGSELADRLSRYGFYRMFGPAGAQLTTAAAPDLNRDLGRPYYPVGVIAGDRSVNPLAWRVFPCAHDGAVSVEASRLDGMTDHIVMPVSHTLMLLDRRVIAQTLHFLREGRFVHADRAAAA